MTEPASWELLVLGGTILTMEPDRPPLEDGAVAIARGRIAAVGPAEDLVDQAPTGKVLDATDCLVLPGLVNTHCHMAMTVLRGIADDLPLKSWLEEHIWPAERSHMSRETVRVGTELAAAEQLLAGVTTVTDMYFFGDEVAAVLDRVGMRGVVSEPMIDFPTPRCATTDEMFARQQELVESYREHPLIRPSVAAHSAYSVSAPNLVREAELADDAGVPLQIHLSETRWEVEQLLESKGVSPVAYLADLGVLSERTVAAHCVHLSPEDVDILAEFEVGVSHNPASNLQLASGIAPVPAMLSRGLSVGLGTDGAASNNSLDLLRDLQLTSLLHKGTSGDPTVLPARRLLEMATTDGARVLGLGERIGTLAPGMEADLVCLSMAGPHATPVYDPLSHLAYAARSSDVRHVLVRGRLVVADRQLRTIDLEEVSRRAREIAGTISTS